VDLHTNGFTEKGAAKGGTAKATGAAALTAKGQSTDTTFSTLGLHMSRGEEGSGLRLSGTAAWRHAFGDVTPGAAMAFVGQASAAQASASSSTFTVQGVPIAKDAAVLEAGLEYQVSDKLSIGASYNGQFGSGAEDHGVRAGLRLKF
jgi:outer membrane autotransporter protein